uniref:Uncharacterized protein n=1 Tax=Kalanchoe fedtschenkoi TaxID=63787 RepID=A0A7N0REZ8_KALFE
MGREVVRQEANNHPGQRSRLWGDKATCNVLRTKKGTSAVKGLHLQFPVPNVFMSSENHHTKRTSKRRGCIDPTSELRSIGIEAFTNMDNLNLLELNNVPLEGNYADFPKTLKWLCWRGFHLESIPADLDLYELVVLDMQNSCLVHAWEGCKYLGALKILDLSYSYRLLDTPDLTWAAGIEVISLEDCTVEIGGVRNLETISDMSASRAKYLRYPGLESLGEKVVRTNFNAPYPMLKGVYQSGVYSVFLLRDHIDEWFTTVMFGSELLYTVPLLPNRSIRAFNVCCVYKCRAYPPLSSETDINADISIKNEGSMWEWSYESATYTMAIDMVVNKKEDSEEVEKDLFLRKVLVTWISHWCVMKHRES